jgi:uncharacterized protein (DUF305 family)
VTETTDDERTRRLAPPTGWNLVALLVAVAFVAAVLGWRVAQPSHPSRDSADVGFLFDMISHHEQAITMSAVELANGTIQDVHLFAEEIHRFQSYEIGLMERLLAERGFTRYEAPDDAMGWMGHDVARDAMPGLASDDEMDALQHAGDDTDAWFLALMIDHHAGGADMAEMAAERADDAGLAALAERMAEIQRQEITELLAAAARADITIPPRGVTWDVYQPTR